jgi:hypothetical protein
VLGLDGSAVGGVGVRGQTARERAFTAARIPPALGWLRLVRLGRSLCGFAAGRADRRARSLLDRAGLRPWLVSRRGYRHRQRTTYFTRQRSRSTGRAEPCIAGREGDCRRQNKGVRVMHRALDATVSAPRVATSPQSSPETLAVAGCVSRQTAAPISFTIALTGGAGSSCGRAVRGAWSSAPRNGQRRCRKGMLKRPALAAMARGAPEPGRSSRACAASRAGGGQRRRVIR